MISRHPPMPITTIQGIGRINVLSFWDLFNAFDRNGVQCLKAIPLDIDRAETAIRYYAAPFQPIYSGTQVPVHQSASESIGQPDPVTTSETVD